MIILHLIQKHFKKENLADMFNRSKHFPQKHDSKEP